MTSASEFLNLVRPRVERAGRYVFMFRRPPVVCRWRLFPVGSMQVQDLERAFVLADGQEHACRYPMRTPDAIRSQT